MTDNSRINLFFSCDDNYLPCFAVALRSLEENASRNYIYDIRILHTGTISKDNMERVIAEFDNGYFNIEFVDITERVKSISEKLHTRDYYSKTTYYRLFIPKLFPNLDKALYLDSDIIVKKDISKLYNVDLWNNLACAIPDETIQTFKVFQDYVENRLTVDSYKHYFNAGILLMNLKEMRKFCLEEKFIKLLNAVTFNVAQDQDYLNVLLKGRVVLMGNEWNKMPFKDSVKREDICLVHYNLDAKPWFKSGILYEEYFWEYAKKTGFYPDLLKIKANHTAEMIEKSANETINLKKIAREQADNIEENKEIALKIEEICGKDERAQDRLKILEKIKLYEEQGLFDQDVEEDPPTIELLPENVDYLHKKLSSKLKSKFAYSIAEVYLKNIIKNKKMIIEKIEGIENLKNLEGGAIITCNHFNAYDSFAIQHMLKEGGYKNGKLFRVIREGNYTNFGGFFGFLMRNCNTLPLSSNRITMVNFVNAVNTILKDGKFVLFYPEQSMWWNYRKPKPLKNGAYHFAVRNNVPVLPCFIAMSDSDIIGEDGFPVQKYSIFISKPIFPEKECKSLKLEAERLKDINYQLWKNIYEEFYNVPLVYNTKPECLPEGVSENSLMENGAFTNPQKL